MNYVLRLQALDGYQAKFNEVFGDRFNRVLCVHHTGRNGDNPHYHFCLSTDYKKQALRVYLKGHFDLAKGNKHLSLKDWDGQSKACSYLFHEGTTELISKGFSEDEVKKFKESNAVIQAKFVKPNQVVDRAVEILRQKQSKEQSKQVVFDTLFDIYAESGEWLPNKFQWERMINKVRLDLAIAEGPAHVRLLKMALYREMFPFD